MGSNVDIEAVSQSVNISYQMKIGPLYLVHIVVNRSYVNFLILFRKN